jgi:hypothetical protein
MVKNLFKKLLFALLLPNLAFAQTGTAPLLIVESSPTHSTVKTLPETHLAPKVRKGRLREHLPTVITIGLTLATCTLAYFYYTKSRQFNALQENFKTQADDLTQLRKNFAETDGKLQVLTQQLETKSTECRNLTDQLQREKNNFLDLKTDHNNLLKEKSRLIESTKGQESTIQQLTSELKKMQQDAQESNAATQLFKKYASDLTYESGQLHTTIEELKEKLTQIATEKSALEVQLASHKIDPEALNSRLQAIQELEKAAWTSAQTKKTDTPPATEMRQSEKNMQKLLELYPKIEETSQLHKDYQTLSLHNKQLEEKLAQYEKTIKEFIETPIETPTEAVSLAQLAVKVQQCERNMYDAARKVHEENMKLEKLQRELKMLDEYYTIKLNELIQREKKLRRSEKSIYERKQSLNKERDALIDLKAQMQLSEFKQESLTQPELALVVDNHM